MGRLFEGAGMFEKALNSIAHTVMCGPSSLTPAERELIATVVSAGNECLFCTNAHAAATRHLLGDRAPLVDAILKNSETVGIDERIRR